MISNQIYRERHGRGAVFPILRLLWYSLLFIFFCNGKHFQPFIGQTRFYFYIWFKNTHSTERKRKNIHSQKKCCPAFLYLQGSTYLCLYHTSSIENIMLFFFFGFFLLSTAHRVGFMVSCITAFVRLITNLNQSHSWNQSLLTCHPFNHKQQFYVRNWLQCNVRYIYVYKYFVLLLWTDFDGSLFYFFLIIICRLNIIGITRKKKR